MHAQTAEVSVALPPVHLLFNFGSHHYHNCYLLVFWRKMSFNRLPLTKKVGEVPENEDKFLSWSGSHGYYTRPATVSNPFKTDKMLNSSFDRNEMINNVTLCTTQRELNKSQVEFKPKTDHDPKMLGRSSSKNYFVDQRLLSHIMKERGTVENFQASFDKVYDALPGSGPERGKYYSIPIRCVRDVVNDCMGLESPEFIVDKFIELSNYHSAGARISWVTFSTLIPMVAVAVEAECRYRRELPALMVLMNRPRIVDKDLGSLGNMSSTYRDNFNMHKDLSFSDHMPDFAYTKTVEPTNKKGLNNAAQILYAGTTKSTYHLPGFKGHIPANVRNYRKLEHSSGEVDHPVANNLRLTQRGMGCVLGYTGHVPHETSGPRQERMTACDPRTTNGASFTSQRAYL